MVRKLGQAALEQRYRTIVTLRQLTDLRCEIQLLHGHGRVRRCLYQILGCACMITLSDSDVTKAFKRRTVIRNDRQNIAQQKYGIVEFPGRDVFLRGGKSMFNIVNHGNVDRRKNAIGRRIESGPLSGIA